MTKEEILVEIKLQSLENKLAIAAVLNNLIEIEEQEIKYNKTVNDYIEKMKSLVGEDFLTSRKHDLVQGRIIIAVILKEQGFGISTIGRILNVDHSTVCYYNKTWNTALQYPKLYQDTIKLYNKFKAII